MRAMIHVLVSAGLLFAGLETVARTPIDLPLSKVSAKPPPYSQIEFVSEGQAFDSPVNERIHGRFHRVVVIRAPIVHDMPTIRIDSMTYGDEICCVQVSAARELSLQRLSALGVSFGKASESEFRFVRWIDAHAFEFKYGHVACRVSKLAARVSRVVCTP
ncbi:hypothetical protein IP84_07125 [beta proteobacterium AAP99]|nr:hypothetical protein IP84_07125 [beta proteobacterium AAP99]